MKLRQHFGKRIIELLIGLTLYAFGIALMVQATLGVSPWDVLTQGLSRITGISFGFMITIISLLVLLLWIPLRQKPGIGTLLNGVIVGPIADIFIRILPQPGELWLQIVFMAGGIVIVGIATGIYIGVHMGPGPRDGLMTGISRRFGWPIWIVRTGIEGTVLLSGWLLGGTFGVGTVAFVLCIGPICQFTLPFFDYQRRLTRKNAVVDSEDPEPTTAQ